jgi:YHS domain-containing protein
MTRKINGWLVLTCAGVAFGCGSNSGRPHPGGGHAHSASHGSMEKPAHTEATKAAASALTLVGDRSLVCMVNDQFMGRPQIPIDVDGKTYFGCCEMCKAKLGNDPKTRTATDPVTGNPVDKASAVIGRNGGGQILYFENERNLAAYSNRGG